MVGGGPAGVELAMAIDAGFKRRYGQVEVTLVHRGALVLGSLGNMTGSFFSANCTRLAHGC